MESNPKLFNGSKFRCVSASLNAEKNAVRLSMGLTDYRSFLRTNWSPRVEELKALGTQDHRDPDSYLAHPLGVGAVLETVDGYLCFIKRSQHVGEYPGYLDCPGGHPEPTNIPVGPAELEGPQNIKLEKRIVEEFFGCVLFTYSY